VKKQEVWTYVAKAMTWAFIIGLGFALGYFEKTNYATNSAALTAVFGSDWAASLAIGLAIMDFMGLARVVTPETDAGKEPEYVKYLFFVWFISSFINAGLTWFAAALQMEHNPNMMAPLVIRQNMWIMPVIVAIAVWCLRFGIIYFFGKLLDEQLHGRSGKSASRPSIGSSLGSGLGGSMGGMFGSGGKKQQQPAKQTQSQSFSSLGSRSPTGHGVNNKPGNQPARSQQVSPYSRVPEHPDAGFEAELSALISGSTPNPLSGSK
jgi:hypothetical protein